jgi:hypothetical protein
MSLKIASIIIGLGSADAGERKEAARELLEMTDDLDKVPLVVSSGTLSVALVLIREEKEYYRYIGAEVIMRIWKAGSSRNDILEHNDLILSTLEHLLANYDVLSATRIEAMKIIRDEIRKASRRASNDGGLSDSLSASKKSKRHDSSARRKTQPSSATSSGVTSKETSSAPLNASASVVRIAVPESGGYNPAALLAALTPREQSSSEKHEDA